jgi:Cdc6-like AAA superfamily ATPase
MNNFAPGVSCELIFEQIQIASAKATLTSQIDAHAQRGIDALVEFKNSQEHQEILDWLTPVNFGVQQSEFQERREPETGNWFIRLEKFKNWINKPQSTLFCLGMPGAGKSFIASTVIEHLHNMFQSDQGAGIAFIFCSFNSPHKQRPEDLLASLLKQLMQKRAVPEDLQELFDQYKSKPQGSRPSINEIYTSLRTATAIYSRIFIVVDALDEYDSRYRTAFLDKIFKLQPIARLNIFATSRYIQEITAIFEDRASTLHRIEIQANDDDVQKFLDSQILQRLRFLKEKDQVRDDLKKEIGAAVRGM